MARMPLLPLALLTVAASANAQEASAPRPGDVYEIALRVTTEGASSMSSSSSSSGGGWIQRVIAVTESGVEMEFDVYSSASEEERSHQWHLPARVLRSPDGSISLLNEAEMLGRLEDWLTRWEFPREACGQWFFTWTAFQIDCEATSILTTIESIDIGRIDLRDGALFSPQGALAPAPLRRESAGPDGATFVSETPISPNHFIQEQAEQDEIINSMMPPPESEEESEYLAMNEVVDAAGSITTTLKTDADGGLVQRVTETSLEFTTRGGTTETDTRREVIDWRRTAAAPK